jgi:ABC-type molybdate transport system permease subunit
MGRVVTRRRTPRLERMASSTHMFWLVLAFGTVLGPWLVMAVMRYAKIPQRRIALPMALSIGWNAAAIACVVVYAPYLIR